LAGNECDAALLRLSNLFYGDALLGRQPNCDLIGKPVGHSCSLRIVDALNDFEYRRSTMEASIPQKPCTYAGADERTQILEDLGLPAYPLRLGAAGMRDLDKVRWTREALGFASLRIEITYSIQKQTITRCSIELSDGIICAIYDVSAETPRITDEPIYLSELDGCKVTPSQRVQRSLSLDRNAARIDQILDSAREHEQQFGQTRIRDLLHRLAFQQPRSRRGRGKLIDAGELHHLEVQKVPIGSIAEHFGVTRKAIYEHRRRLRCDRPEPQRRSRLNRDSDEC
jgi:hypothetical protein